MLRYPLEYHPLLGHALRLLTPREARPVWLRPGHENREYFYGYPYSIINIKHKDKENISDATSSNALAWEKLGALLAETKARWPDIVDDCPGPIAGFVSYPAGGDSEAINKDMPAVFFGAYEYMVCIDHSRRMAETIVLSNDDSMREDWLRFLESAQYALSTPSDFHLQGAFEPLTSKDRYQRDIQAIKSYLLAGDCYQVNYTQAFSADCQGHSAHAMQRLLDVSHAPYAAWLSLPEGDILSLSPELFIEVKNRQMTTKPIKGTAARRADGAEDIAQAERLRKSSKCQAENLMIVDLLRNDFGQHAQTGSVEVKHLFAVESLPQVHHLVSTITGRLKPDSDSVALLRDCFPGGSITGAPKKRAMEIIHELEPVARSVYCGSIGHLHPNGDCQFNIAIRTLVRQNGRITAWAGGGIVADSDAEAEYQECFDKIGLLMQTLEGMK